MRSTNNLTFLRWVGASLVLVGHAHTFLGLPEPLFLGHITLGPLGVFMFFSISGYQLCRRLAGRKVSVQITFTLHDRTSTTLMADQQCVGLRPRHWR
jgi:peptidoglycan/LPS O-acetylase OafA/YrhL